MLYASEDINQSNFLMMLESQLRSLGKLVADTYSQRMTMSMLYLIKFSTPFTSMSTLCGDNLLKFVSLLARKHYLLTPTPNASRVVKWSKNVLQKSLKVLEVHGSSPNFVLCKIYAINMKPGVSSITKEMRLNVQ